MALYEVELRRVSTVLVSVDADSITDAKNRVSHGEGQETSYEFIEQQEVVSARLEDDRFDDDDTELVDAYELEQEETDE